MARGLELYTWSECSDPGTGPSFKSVAWARKLLSRGSLSSAGECTLWWLLLEVLLFLKSQRLT